MGLDLERGERGLLVGASGTGKSTLGTELVRRFLQNEPHGQVLILDSKPRYRATWTPRGLRAKYKNWVQGDRIEGSVALHDSGELRDCQLISRCVIFQSHHPNGAEVPYYEDQGAELARHVFRQSGPQRPTLLYVDELYDFAHGQSGLVDRRLLRTVRAGRERNMAVLVGAQRPRSIPIPTLTEARKLYVFALEFDEDIKYLGKHGVRLRALPTGHAFVVAERDGGRTLETTMRLNLAKGGRASAMA